jgi:thiamine biosynthesis protein ThiC
MIKENMEKQLQLVTKHHLHTRSLTQADIAPGYDHVPEPQPLVGTDA